MPSLWTRWWPWRKASATTQTLLWLTTPGQAVSPPRDYAALAREGYGAVAVVYTCIELIAGVIGGLTWIVQRRSDGQWRELDAHPLLTLLQQPNPAQSRASLFESVIGYLLISGNTYIERVGPGSGPARLTAPPRELYALRPDRVQVVPGTADQLVAGYEYRAGGSVTTLEAPLVLHLKYFHPLNDWYGLSPIQVLARTVDCENVAVAWNVSLLEKGARPSGALVTPDRLDTAEKRRLRAEFQEAHTGADRAGVPILLEGGMDWKQLGLSPTDMDWLRLRERNALDLAMAFGVPGEMIGLQHATFENRREARRMFYLQTVLPLADRLRDELARWLVPLYGDNLRLDYDRDAIDALQEDRAKLWESVQKAEWLTINEKRAATGYDERPDGDVLLVRSLLMPLDQLSSDTGPSFADLTPAADQPSTKAALASDPRGALWLKQVRQYAPIERRYLAAIRRLLANQREAVLARVLRDEHKAMDRKRLITDEILFALDEATDQWREVSRPFFEEAVRRGYETVTLEVGVGAGFDEQAPEPRLQIDYQLRQLAGVSETVRHGLEQVIAEGLSSDESPRELAARIREYYSGLSAGRAQTIARTEIARAYNQARADAMRTMGITTHEWLSARDERVRTAPFNHAIDGERVTVGMPFSNGLRYPSDPQGEPGNVINCRCVAIPATSAED
jgi:HK97 family phage portal protein